MLEPTEYIKIFIALLAIVNPLGAIPIVLALTSNAPHAEHRKVTRITVLSVAIILFISLLLGEAILQLFGISINSFRVGGGILILLMAISMLQARESPVRFTQEEANEGASRTSVAVVPLSMPLLAGPGSISTVILYANKGDSLWHYIFIGMDILFLVLVLRLSFQFIPWISKHITQTGINIFSRVMGLILAAIAIEFIANGLKGLFPILA